MNRRQRVNDALARRKAALVSFEEIVSNVQAVEAEVVSNLEQQEIARKAAKVVQDGLATKLSGIVTKALTTVFEDPIEFVAQFVERRGVSECDLYLRIGEYDYDILNGQGGGIADVCSVCLQMAFIMMSQVNRVLIIDEPARHMSSLSQERFISVLRELCQELNFTIIMVTHAEAFIDGADKIFKIIKRGGISHVTADN